MTKANAAIQPVHDRMPALLHADEHDRWLHGDFEDLLALQARTFPEEVIVTTPTDELWSKPKATKPAETEVAAPTLL
jgi:putative SOS response-associated peptidase YedK